MARYKPYDSSQDKLIPVSFRDQILPGTFEYALSELVDQHIDLTRFASRYANDDTGRLSSRKLEEACARNITFMALSADTHLHFTTRQGIAKNQPLPTSSRGADRDIKLLSINDLR